MKRFLNAVKGFLVRVFSRDFVEKIVNGIEVAAPYIEAAYVAARFAAQLTPTRKDDELIELARRLGVEDLWRTDLTQSEKIARIVYLSLKAKYPDAPERVLRRAIEIAYAALKP